MPMRRITPNRFATYLNVGQIAEVLDGYGLAALAFVRLPTMEAVHKDSAARNNDRGEFVERRAIAFDRRIVLAQARVKLFHELHIFNTKLLHKSVSWLVVGGANFIAAACSRARSSGRRAARR